MIVRAINIRQPWCSFITSLPPEHRKDVENRSFRLRDVRGAPWTGLLALVASATLGAEEHAEACDFAYACGVPEYLLPERGALELGGLVGVARLTGYLEPGERGSPWHVDGAVGWKLEGAIALPFRRVRGRQGPFRLELTPGETDALRAAKLAA
jgi:hypothetical protein